MFGFLKPLNHVPMLCYKMNNQIAEPLLYIFQPLHDFPSMFLVCLNVEMVVMMFRLVLGAWV